jgi:hypothetical protein
LLGEFLVLLPSAEEAQPLFGRSPSLSVGECSVGVIEHKFVQNLGSTLAD